ncbi:alpha/beta hydrolase [Candidatus Woesearchaeota archaeon]|jgi:pimeloyl-ACP methyl ester carboxylesterase|nr:alpha/beta hydrolase [Candidatus Woesearchaeota archaeon]MBT4368769.1 alpha/beta hydrolase [Candidatus Woesearchaeota archaeon]MBT4712058.1 alpha/beta hydrolase [Candidatus Woesearchaeota archaeon]MBT6639194.1 alpha/beta hydrolase [Candidatus Woesearchaeota archaeon]MBT7134394.1 alpha/beta hydrolase [Candidatus Woesearchaeota archaeon]
MTYLNIDGLRIYYIKKGKGEPVVLIPGIYCDSRTYKNLIPILAEKYTVYVPDMPSHGKSDSYQQTMSLEDFSKVLEKMIKAWGIKKPIVMAHSAGCILAIKYALSQPVKELVIAAPAGLIKMQSLMQIFFELSIKKIAFACKKRQKKTKWVLKIGMDNFFKNLFNKWFWKTLKKNYAVDFSKEIIDAKFPITILAAKEDEMFDFELIKKIAKPIKMAKIIAIDGTHDWPVMKPEAIRKWMKK